MGANSAARGPASTARAGATPRIVNNGYQTLFTVQFRHSYYNASGGDCPDFQVVPTPDCAKLMQSLGMVFKDHGNGFSVLVAAARADAMVRYVSSHYSASSPGKGYWTWLSFLLVSRNTGFIGITNLPISTNPMQQNLHVSNLETVWPGGQLVLGGSAGVGPDALYPITGPTLTVPTPRGKLLTLTDLSGATVPASVTANDSTTSFGLGNLPYGFYTVAFTTKAGKPTTPPKGWTAPTDFLFVPAQPQSLCVLDLLLTQPLAGIGDPSAFPIPPLPVPPLGAPAGVTLQPVSLVLPFQARDTYWCYYIVSKAKGRLAGDLAISGSGATFAKSNESLPNGDAAVLFTANTALPLQQTSTYRFKLSGHRQGANGSRDQIKVAVLPAAPPTPVWPGPSDNTLSGSSEIYVYV